MGTQKPAFFTKRRVATRKEGKKPVSLVGRVRQHRNFEFAAKRMQADAP